MGGWKYIFAFIFMLDVINYLCLKQKLCVSTKVSSSKVNSNDSMKNWICEILIRWRTELCMCTMKIEPRVLSWSSRCHIWILPGLCTKSEPIWAYSPHLLVAPKNTLQFLVMSIVYYQFWKYLSERRKEAFDHVVGICTFSHGLATMVCFLGPSDYMLRLSAFISINSWTGAREKIAHTYHIRSCDTSTS